MSEKLKLIQCGVGGFGRGWLDVTTASPDFEVVAIVDLSPTNLETAGNELSIAPEKRFTDLATAVKEVPADAILSVTPPPVHVQHARIAFNNGLHFMSEKPIAETLADAKEMIALSEKSGKQLVVSQQYRFYPPNLKFRELLRSEVIGDLGHGHLDFYIPADFTGTFREKMKFPLLLDMAIHHVDLIRSITGKNVVKVTAQSFKPTWSWYEHDPGLKMLLELEGGVSFSYSGDWSALGKSTSWSGNWRLQGSKGSLHLENEKISIARSGRWSSDQTVEEVAETEYPRTGQTQTLYSFAEAIRTGVPAETSGQDNLYSIGVLLAAIKSIEEGRTVLLSELI